MIRGLNPIRGTLPISFCDLRAYVGKRAHMSVRALAHHRTIILSVVLGQHRGCGSEYQLGKIVARCANIEKSVSRLKTLQNLMSLKSLDALRPYNHCFARKLVSHARFVSLDELYTPCETWKIKISSQTGQNSTILARFLNYNGARSLAVFRVRVQNASADWTNQNNWTLVQKIMCRSKKLLTMWSFSVQWNN